MLRCPCGKDSTHQFIRKDGLTQNYHFDGTPPCETAGRPLGFKNGLFVFSNKSKLRGYADDFEGCPICKSKNLTPHRYDERFVYEGRKLSVTVTEHECLDCTYKWYQKDPEESKKKVIADAISRPRAHKRRLNNYGRRKMKSILFKEDSRCVSCGSYDDLTIDHIIPLSKGGSNGPDNLQILCDNCNNRKGDTI